MNASLQILNTWIENFKNNIINDNILLVVFRDANHDNRTIDIKRLKEVLFKDMNEEYYQLFNINELGNIDELQNYKCKKNLIVLGNIGMNINKIANTDFEILLYFNPLKYIIKFQTFNDLLAFDNSKNPYIKLDVIKKRDPLEIITSNNFMKINDSVKVLFLPYIFNKNFPLFQSIDILKSNRNTYSYTNYLFTLENDIYLLVQKRKLTARLAIAIYKVATLRFYENKTVIGSFYRKELNIKSKAYKLPYPVRPQIVKVYDLDRIKK